MTGRGEDNDNDNVGYRQQDIVIKAKEKSRHLLKAQDNKQTWHFRCV